MEIHQNKLWGKMFLKIIEGSSIDISPDSEFIKEQFWSVEKKAFIKTKSVKVWL